MREKLVAEARRQGNPDTIGHHELSAFILREGVVPVLMKPIRSFVGSQELLFVALAGLAVLVRRSRSA